MFSAVHAAATPQQPQATSTSPAVDTAGADGQQAQYKHSHSQSLHTAGSAPLLGPTPGARISHGAGLGLIKHAATVVDPAATPLKGFGLTTPSAALAIPGTGHAAVSSHASPVQGSLMSLASTAASGSSAASGWSPSSSVGAGTITTAAGGGGAGGDGSDGSGPTPLVQGMSRSNTHRRTSSGSDGGSRLSLGDTSRISASAYISRAHAAAMASRSNRRMAASCVDQLVLDPSSPPTSNINPASRGKSLPGTSLSQGSGSQGQVRTSGPSTGADADQADSSLMPSTSNGHVGLSQSPRLSISSISASVRKQHSRHRSMGAALEHGKLTATDQMRLTEASLRPQSVQKVQQGVSGDPAGEGGHKTLAK